MHQSAAFDHRTARLSSKLDFPFEASLRDGTYRGMHIRELGNTPENLKTMGLTPHLGFFIEHKCRPSWPVFLYTQGKKGGSLI